MAAAVQYEGEGTPSLAPETVEGWADRMLSAMGIPEAELSVLLCDDARIHTLNREYRGYDKPTDVLAFSLLEGEGVLPAGVPLALGDVVISLPAAARQASDAGKDLAAEVQMLLAHGLLHLLGFDHAESEEARRMRARTDLLVAACSPGASPTVDNR